VRLGLFGGSFDPFHRGHLAVARAALDALGLGRVLVLPTGRPPHKPDRRFAPALARYAMAELALLDEPRIEVSGLELDERRPSYTVETLERLREERPATELVLIVGSDSLAELDTWRRWREIPDLCELAVVPRPGSERLDVEASLPAELAQRLASARVHWLEGSMHPAAASRIRQLLAAGEAVPGDWLDPRVLTFLDKYSLYR